MDGSSHNGRGRIVMLVDNAVQGDSRVQKSAESAAAAGWEVFLLGTGPARHHWDLGGAKVRLLPRPAPLHVRRHTLRQRSLRRPLAYPNPAVSAYRRQWTKAWRAELRVRRAALQVAARENRSAGSALRLRMGGAWLRVPGAASRVMTRWAALRERHRHAASVARRADLAQDPVDRLAVALWKVLLRRRAWRRLEPHLLDFDLAFAREIDALAPDLIHAHDVRMLGVGARAAIRLRAAGHPVRLLWDAHEYVPGVRAPGPRWSAAISSYEREYAPLADAVVAVSDNSAELLERRHRLPERPEVVLNAPSTAPATSASHPTVPDLRALCGVAPDTPLLVYSGVVAAQRGVTTMIEGLTALPEAHTVLVVPDPPPRQLRGLLRRAEELGVAERLHALPYVPHQQVVPFLAQADVGVLPLLHWPHHELALSTMFFECAHARLPLVVSDVRTMADTTRTLGQGEVFRAGDALDYVRAVRAVLAAPGRYRSAYDRPALLDEWTWEVQAEKLDRVYRRLLTDHPRSSPAAHAPAEM